MKIDKLMFVALFLGIGAFVGSMVNGQPMPYPLISFFINGIVSYIILRAILFIVRKVRSGGKENQLRN